MGIFGIVALSSCRFKNTHDMAQDMQWFEFNRV
jgi:hypothetical protein